MEFNLIMCAVLLMSLIYIVKSENKFLSVCLSYLFLSGMVGSFYPEIMNHHFVLNKNVLGLITISSLSTRSVLYVITFYTMVNKINSEKLISILSWVSIVDCIIIIIHRYWMDAPYGLMLTSCMDAPMIAIMYPLVVSKRNWYIVSPIFISAVFITTSAVGIGALCVSVFILIYKKFDYKYLILPIILFAIAIKFVPGIFNSSGRFPMYIIQMKWWWDNINHAFGSGMGTFYGLGPYVQMATNNMNGGNTFTFLHSDWLQIIFEFGFVGIFLALSLFITMLFRVRSNYVLLSAIVAYAASMCFCMPMLYPITSIIGILLIKLAFEQ